jgi:putative nucleotidyltransferase with HDIG domain
VFSRGTAWSILTEFTQSDSLRKHARAVEASMRAYAARYGEDAEAWGVAGLLHDFDYEMHPRAPAHPMKGAEILLARGVPDAVVYAILAHADYSGMPRIALLDRALYACDELSGFVHACALVRPGRVIAGLEPASVKKKLRDKAFARTVNRDDVYRGAEGLGVDLDRHIAFVVGALTDVAEEIGLAGASPSPS